MKNAQKHDLLMAAGTHFNDLPGWQKRGVGVYRETVPKAGTDPRTGQTVTTTRNRLKVDLELPWGAEYAAFIEDRMKAAP